MSKQIQAIRGMNDCLPEMTGLWQWAEQILRDTVASFGYQEIRMPIVESTDLFKRSIGEVTDIVEKEMYTFADRNGDSLTLRPEGTASCVRAGNQHGLLYNQQQRLWYLGPMFRHERPQKGRYRQFHQFGVETYGISAAEIDAEVIGLSADLWRAFGISEHVTLELNTLGSNEARENYKRALVDYLLQFESALDDDSKRRLHTNPLRILDSKNPDVQGILDGAPCLHDCLDSESKVHFDRLTKLLDAQGISYRINPRLVRGLDYYNQTVFEWVTESLGAQGTVCAGGRYDGLVEQLGGKSTPAVGFALGMERLVLLLESLGAKNQVSSPVDVYVMPMNSNALAKSMSVASELRRAVDGLKVQLHCGGGNFKKQMKRADKSGAIIGLIIGETEMSQDSVSVKYLRDQSKEQQTLTLDELIASLTVDGNG